MDSIQKQLKSACEDGGEVSFRDYSGRGMFGHKCIAITSTMRECQRVIAAVISAMVQEMFESAIDTDDSDREAQAAYDNADAVQQAIEKLMNFSTDSMGHDVVMYWPDIEPEPEEALTDQWIDQQSERTLLEWVSENSEYHSDELDVESRDQLRKTVRIMRDRMVEDNG